MRLSVLLFLATFALVAGGCLLYLNESVGWAQLLWIMASGTAGGAIMAWSSND